MLDGKSDCVALYIEDREGTPLALLAMDTFLRQESNVATARVDSHLHENNKPPSVDSSSWTDGGLCDDASLV